MRGHGAIVVFRGCATEAVARLLILHGHSLTDCDGHFVWKGSRVGEARAISRSTSIQRRYDGKRKASCRGAAHLPVVRGYAKTVSDPTVFRQEAVEELRRESMTWCRAVDNEFAWLVVSQVLVKIAHLEVPAGDASSEGR